MAFHFRQFDVADDYSTMKIGTDSMLLGAWACPGKARKILDIGTGCGVLALMMAQKSEAIIEAIDIDLLSIIEAQGNFIRSQWFNRLFAIHIPLQVFTENSQPGYDFIISNPPYFSNALKSSSARKNSTRHDQRLSREELIRSVSQILTPEGSFALILPADDAEEFVALCKTNGVYLRRRMTVYPKPAVLPMRTLMEFTKSQCNNMDETELTILDCSGTFSAEYLALTRNFHNF